MKTFSIQTLGCKVNHYEGEQLAALLRARGLRPVEPDDGAADLRVVHTCSVTVQAASKSRQTVRRAVRLPLLGNVEPEPSTALPCIVCTGPRPAGAPGRARVVITGCWATSDEQTAAALPGVDAVLTHRHDVAAELDRLLAHWQKQDAEPTATPPQANPMETACETPLVSKPANDGWIMEAGASAGELTGNNKSKRGRPVKENPEGAAALHEPSGAPLRSARGLVGASPLSQAAGAAQRSPGSFATRLTGMTTLPVLGQHQATRQRATLKVQDGCDAHCTYCIIPSLRRMLWSKPLDDAVAEARALVDAGHVEIVLTGIFLGAFGRPTALRRRQPVNDSRPPLGELVAALCRRVSGLRRVRLSSLEPGDLTSSLIDVLRAHPQVVPHFHLPLQSGSDHLLRRMNRQYTRDDFLRMLDRLNNAFDRPALTSDVIVGFPGESDEEFERTAEVVDRARFIHVHAFSFSPRPGTAAARWRDDFVHGPVVNERIERLNRMAAENSYAFRKQFVGEAVELLIESQSEISDLKSQTPHACARHGRCERYFAVTVPAARVETGNVVRARIARVLPDATFGEVLQ